MAGRKRRTDGYSITKRADGRWEARITIGYNENGNPKRKSIYGATRAQVVEDAQVYAQKVRTGIIKPNSKVLTVGEWLDAWMETYVNPKLAPKTVKYYRDFVELHLKPYLGITPISKLLPNRIQMMLNDKLKSGLQPNTVRGIHAVLRTALNQAWKNSLIEQNPALKVSPPKIPHQDPEFLEAWEVQALLQATRGTVFEHLFALQCILGTRLGEILGITWECVDFDARTLSIEKQLQRVDGSLILRELKSRASRRTLPLTSGAIEALKAQRTLVNELASENPMNLVFLNREGRPVDQKTVDKYLRRALDQCGIRHVSFHKLRHTVATLMVAEGVELHQVKEHLGHSQIGLTANLYAHGVSSAQRSAVERLERVVRGE